LEKNERKLLRKEYNRRKEMGGKEKGKPLASKYISV
jgi:hypothetical protein